MSAECENQPFYETVVIPALLRHSRKAYGVAMRRAVAEIGCDDIPNNGLYVIGGMAKENGSIPLNQLIRELGVSKQLAGQLVDTLVLRGYLERSASVDDRRKLNVILTPRGVAAAAAQAKARAQVDADLEATVGAECVAHMRRALGALCIMGQRADSEIDAV